MCYSRACAYERLDGTCKGRPVGRSLMHRPACMDDEDFEGYKASADEDAILEFDLRRGENDVR
jgi:hypothetical protein